MAEHGAAQDGATRAERLHVYQHQTRVQIPVNTAVRLGAQSYLVWLGPPSLGDAPPVVILADSAQVVNVRPPAPAGTHDATVAAATAATTTTGAVGVGDASPA